MTLTIKCLTSLALTLFLVPNVNPVTVDMLEPGAPSADWESLNFWMSNNVTDYGEACKKHSPYYCMDSYLTQPNRMLTESQKNQSMSEGYRELLEFELLISRQWRHINLIDEINPSQCCLLQGEKYLMNGYVYKQMSPTAYFDVLRDYRNESMPLNNIGGWYFENVCKNVIIDIGFGPGALRRSGYLKEGKPYLFLGKEFENGTPGVPSMVVDYNEPGSQLTFHWFKHNVMCRDHPSICGRDSPKRKERNQQMKKGDMGRGSKKSRRRKQQRFSKN